MNLNKYALQQLMNERFNKSYTKLARDIGVNAAHVYWILVKNYIPGIKFFNGIMKWYTDNQLDYREYIFLPKPLIINNDKTNV